MGGTGTTVLKHGICTPAVTICQLFDNGLAKDLHLKGSPLGSMYWINKSNLRELNQIIHELKLRSKYRSMHHYDSFYVKKIKQMLII